MAHILIAGNDLATVARIEAETAAMGHRPQVAGDGYEAEALALAETPDLVMAESAIDIFPGLELFARLRADPDVPPALPLVLISDDPVSAHDKERHGVTAVVPKTIAADELRELLVNLLGDAAG